MSEQTTFPKGFNEASATPHSESEEGRRRLAALGLSGEPQKDQETSPAGADADLVDEIEGFGNLAFTPPAFSEEDADEIEAAVADMRGSPADEDDSGFETIKTIPLRLRSLSLVARMPIPEEGRLTVLESPYGGDIERNEAYARACLSDCLDRGEAPLASHLLYTQPGVLDDSDPVERGRGINAGLAWMAFADRVAAYTDLGISSGMGIGIAHALANGVVVEYRSLGEDFMEDFQETYGVVAG